MRKNRKYTAEEKIKYAKMLANGETTAKGLEKETGISDSQLRRWREQYQEYGESYFYEEHRGKNGSGNPYAALHTSKNLTREQYLELENLKLKIENERLKKGYMVKGAGADKEFVMLKDVNTKSWKD